MMQEFNNHIKTFNSKSNRLVKDIDAENRSIDYGFYKIGKLKVEVKDYEDQIKINEAEINRYNLFLKKISDGLDIKQEKVKPLERRNTSIENYKNQQKEKEAKNQNQKNQFEH